MSEQQNPNGFYEVPKDVVPENVTAEWIREHGTFHPAEPQKYYIPNTDALTDAELARVLAMNNIGGPPTLLVPKRNEPETVSPELRLAIREEVERALNPGTVDPKRFASVTFVLDTGERYRGVVYAIERTEGDA